MIIIHPTKAHIRSHAFLWSPSSPAISSMSSGGCSFPASTSPHLPSLNLSIKSERSSPELMSSPTSPPLHHLRQHSPISNPDAAHRSPPDACTPHEAKEFLKDGYPAGDGPQLEMSDGWQR